MNVLFVKLPSWPVLIWLKSSKSNLKQFTCSIDGTHEPQHGSNFGLTGLIPTNPEPQGRPHHNNFSRMAFAEPKFGSATEIEGWQFFPPGFLILYNAVCYFTKWYL